MSQISRCAAPTCKPFCAQILQRVLPQALHRRLAYLSGPSFAAEARFQLCITLCMSVWLLSATNMYLPFGRHGMRLAASFHLCRRR